MTKHHDCAEKCQAAEQKHLPECADECAWIERYASAPRKAPWRNEDERLDDPRHGQARAINRDNRRTR